MKRKKTGKGRRGKYNVEKDMKTERKILKEKDRSGQKE